MGGLTRQTGKASQALSSLDSDPCSVPPQSGLILPREISARDILLLPWGSHTVPVIAAALLLLLLLLPLGGLVMAWEGGSAND